MIFNVTSGGGTGGTLTVTAPAGVTITVTNGKKTKVKTADAQGQATFKGLDTGTWTVTISAGSDMATATVEIVADYEKTMTFFSATITVTYPEGSTCTCSDGETTLTAPDTSGSCTFTVPNAGEWTMKAGDRSRIVTITQNGQNETVDLTKLYLIKAGDPCTETTGGWNDGTGGMGQVAWSDGEVEFTYTGGSTGTSASRVCYTSTANKIDISAYSKLNVVFKYLKTSSSSYGVVHGITGSVITEIANVGNFVAYKKNTSSIDAETTKTLDITEKTGEVYVELMGYYVTAEIIDVYLS